MKPSCPELLSIITNLFHLHFELHQKRAVFSHYLLRHRSNTLHLFVRWRTVFYCDLAIFFWPTTFDRNNFAQADWVLSLPFFPSQPQNRCILPVIQAVQARYQALVTTKAHRRWRPFCSEPPGLLCTPHVFRFHETQIPTLQLAQLPLRPQPEPVARREAMVAVQRRRLRPSCPCPVHDERQAAAGLSPCAASERINCRLTDFSSPVHSTTNSERPSQTYKNGLARTTTKRFPLTVLNYCHKDRLETIVPGLVLLLQVRYTRILL